VISPLNTKLQDLFTVQSEPTIYPDVHFLIIWSDFRSTVCKLNEFHFSDSHCSLYVTFNFGHTNLSTAPASLQSVNRTMKYQPHHEVSTSQQSVNHTNISAKCQPCREVSTSTPTLSAKCKPQCEVLTSTRSVNLTNISAKCQPHREVSTSTQSVNLTAKSQGGKSSRYMGGQWRHKLAHTHKGKGRWHPLA
jgi:hypothetical protein